MRHHEDTLAAYVASVERRPEVLGVVLIGSVARGTPRPDSDVDVYLVVTDDAYARARADGRIADVSHEGVTYPGGYVDIKLASPHYLVTAAERADDPTRASFVDARVCLDRTGELPGRIGAIGSLPEEAWAGRIGAYRAQATLYGGYFLVQGERLDEEFLRQHSAVHLALATGRAALARHRRFFRGQKYLARMLAELELPERFRTAWSALLRTPTAAAGAELLMAVEEWLGPREPMEADLSRFISDNELAWLHGTVPPEFW